MFDSLQEGIVVISDNQIDFMNDFSKKFTRFISTLEKDPKTNNEEPDILRKKMFFIFENNKDK
jgi:hypothetical protein